MQGDPLKQPEGRNTTKNTFCGPVSRKLNDERGATVNPEELMQHVADRVRKSREVLEEVRKD